MVLSVITLAAVTPLLATSTLQLQESAQRQQNQQSGLEEELKTEKCHLRVRASDRMSPGRKDIVKDRIVVLRNGKLYVEREVSGPDHPFTGYFLPYPAKDFDGVVSTIDKMNMLNWIYIDCATFEVKYGVRAEADKHITGPMGILSSPDGELRLICMQWEGFSVVEEEEDEWALYFDKDNSNLKDKVQDKRITEVELIRDASEQIKTRVKGPEEEVD